MKKSKAIKGGRPIEFKTPRILWKKACKYFQWCDDNPLKEEKVNFYMSVASKISINKLRPYSIGGLVLFLGVGEAYFRQFNTEKHQEFSTVITTIKNIIYVQQFTGAAANLLNVKIISRTLGLIDKQQQEIIRSITIDMDQWK